VVVLVMERGKKVGRDIRVSGRCQSKGGRKEIRVRHSCEIKVYVQSLVGSRCKSWPHLFPPLSCSSGASEGL